MITYFFSWAKAVKCHFTNANNTTHEDARQQVNKMFPKMHVCVLFVGPGEGGICYETLSMLS